MRTIKGIHSVKRKLFLVEGDMMIYIDKKINGQTIFKNTIHKNKLKID